MKANRNFTVKSVTEKKIFDGLEVETTQWLRWSNRYGCFTTTEISKTGNSYLFVVYSQKPRKNSLWQQRFMIDPSLEEKTKMVVRNALYEANKSATNLYKDLGKLNFYDSFGVSVEFALYSGVNADHIGIYGRYLTDDDRSWIRHAEAILVAIAENVQNRQENAIREQFPQYFTTK